MPWNNKGGQGGGWQGGGNNNGPWGQGPRGGGQGGGGGGQQPPNLDDLIRQGQDKLKDIVPGGGSGKMWIPLIVVLLVVAWALTGFYNVQPDEQGVEMLFGKQVGEPTQPGLQYNFPSPIGAVLLPKVTTQRQTDVGFARGGRDRPEESLMLTGDENIVNIDFSVFWKVDKADLFLFNIKQPEQTLKAVAESAMREVIGRTPIQDALTEKKRDIEKAVQGLVQTTLDEYKAGILVTEVKLQQVDPPEQVIDKFRDVQRAKADRERLKNEAEAYENQIIPLARGEAEQMLRKAEAYKEQKIAEAQGEASRFTAIQREYARSPEVTARRLYLETMEEVMGKMDKIILDNKQGGGVVPYLPLNELSGKGAVK